MLSFRIVAEILLKAFQCERCVHEWVPRDKVQIPTVCPRCKSPYWNRPRTQRSSNKAKDRGNKGATHREHTRRDKR
jgi:hypothetical protein